MSYCRLCHAKPFAVTGRKYMQKMHLPPKCHGIFLNLQVTISDELQLLMMCPLIILSEAKDM